ncbi:MAG: ABC transporter permease [Actinomycetota bacterium]|nr:ABC transporter permease [Actinomycetota bacterium]
MTGNLLHLVRAEWLKASTTKLLWIMVLGALGFTALNVVALILVAPEASAALLDIDALQSPEYLTSVLASASSASLFVLLLGIIAMTGEYRHMTITSTFLAAPRRGRVVLAKGVTYAVLGAAIAVVSVAWCTLVAFAVLIGREHAPITAGMVGSILFGVALGLAIYAVVGVSVGALIKNQVAAIVIAILWVMLVEPLLSVFVSGIGKWLPGGALNAAMNVTTQADLTAADVLPVWGGAVLLLAYAVVFATVASLTTVRRDIT